MCSSGSKYMAMVNAISFPIFCTFKGGAKQGYLFHQNYYFYTCNKQLIEFVKVDKI